MKKTLVIRMGAIGDVILASPAVLNLKISYPESRLFFLTRHNLVPLVGRMAGVDEVLEFPTRASAHDLFRMGEYLDTLGLDSIIDLHGNIRSKYLLKHVAAGTKVQYHKRRLQRFFSVRLKKIYPDIPHTIDLYNGAVEKVGGRVYARRPVIRPTRENRATLKFAAAEPVVAIAPGASYPTKQWFPDRFGKLAVELFKQLSASIVMIIPDRDMEYEKLGQQIPHEKLETMINTDLPSLADIIEQCDLMICNDSGLSHLAGAVGTPVIALFGPTHPVLGFGPRGLRDTVIDVDEPCRPCSLHGKRACYRDERYCFSRIEVGDVFTVATEKLDAGVKGTAAIFVDRDGTLIKEKGYISSPDDVEPERNSTVAVKKAAAAGFKVIGLSNQSGIARGYFDTATAEKVNARTIELFAARGAPIEEILFCPHHPRGNIPEFGVECDCRKPHAGLVETAALKYDINPFRSWVIGDKLTDVQLAYTTGGRGILVRTGFGRAEEDRLHTEPGLAPETVADNLHAAVEYITRQSSGE